MFQYVALKDWDCSSKRLSLNLSSISLSHLNILTWGNFYVMKEEMVREQKIYRQYLAQRREEDKAQEKELDRILEEEEKKKLAEKDKELRLEKEARKQLVNEVMCTRKLQVQEKCKEVNPNYIIVGP